MDILNVLMNCKFLDDHAIMRMGVCEDHGSTEVRQ